MIDTQEIIIGVFGVVAFFLYMFAREIAKTTRRAEDEREVHLLGIVMVVMMIILIFATCFRG